jgi:glutamate carboxypeptidase
MTSPAAATYFQHLTSRQDAMVQLLERLVRIESPSLDANAQPPVMQVLAEAFEQRGFRTRRLPGRASGGTLYARPARREKHAPYQLLLGHVDTVWPVGTLDQRPIERDEHRLRGPGAFDMKAGLVQLLFAIEALEATGTELTVTPVVLVNTDEEIGSRESTPVIQRLSRGADRVFVLEPAAGPEGKLKTSRKGIGRFTVRVYGQAAHAGLDPGKGASAILELSLVIQKLFALNDVERGVTVNVGTIDGGLRPNVVAPESSAVVDVRVPTRKTAREVEAAIHQITATTSGTRIEIDGRIGRPPMEPSPANRRLWELARRAADELDLSLGEMAAGGGSDGNTSSQFAPTLDGLGPVVDGAHAPHEFVQLDRMPERAALLARLLACPPLGKGEET